MALIIQRVGAPEAYPWGHMVRVDFRDTNTGRLYHEELNFPVAPEDAVKAVAVEAMRLRVETLIAAEMAEANPAPPPAEYRVICEDGTEVLL